ncbi:signal transduction histidine kinase [Catenuloplanes nepalensis]|uniref:histidine kinase n=1 Tax=Catenuloplanes nepalensis TaxID=587533 RepID=A0ABT9MSA3_9ACTN|nr:ATP-binding protein [Catenuloplanes nepalensis]MDP9794254.1 signal transduction histidine kinase [Catenuloplanes nepalensis]
MLRLVQESVTNARRHAAGAREIAATVRTDAGTVRIEVRDDGPGAAANGGRPAAGTGGRAGGFGLVGMRERVHLLGGRFTAGPATGGGWRVTAELPLHRPDT